MHLTKVFMYQIESHKIESDPEQPPMTVALVTYHRRRHGLDRVNDSFEQAWQKNV